MDTVTKLNLKSAFLRAALHLQMAPMLFIPSAFLFFDNHMMSRKGFIKHLDRLVSSEAVVPQDHPVHDMIAPLARKAGIDVVRVVKNAAPDGGDYAAVSSKNNYALLSFSQKALDDVSDNADSLRSIIGHELTHASRHANSYHAAFSGAWSSALLAGVGFYLPQAFRSMPAAAVIAVVSLFSAAYGIPKLSRVLQRNEEHLADIGSGKLTGEPQHLAGYFKDDLADNERYIKRVKSGQIKQSRYGSSHPTHAERIAVLCDVFNMKSEDLPVPGASAGPELPQADYKLHP